MYHSQLRAEAPLPHKGRLLVAENNAALREYLVAILRADGYEVAAASTSDDLVDTLAVSFRPDLGSGAFDLVIVEDRLVLHGELALLGDSTVRPRIPPVVLLGSFRDREFPPGDFGADTVVRVGKPIDMEGLRAVVRRLVQNDTEESYALLSGRGNESRIVWK